MARWLASDVAFDVVDHHTDHPIITFSVSTPEGDIPVMAEPDRRGSTLIMRGVHMHGERSKANSLGAAPDDAGCGSDGADGCRIPRH
jgi:hypothetical protein